MHGPVLTISLPFLISQGHWRSDGKHVPHTLSAAVTGVKNPRIFKEKTCTGDATICPQGWNRIHNKCFFRFELEKTWRDGQANCLAYRGSLVIFTFQNEVEILTHYLGTSSYWIGLKKQNASQRWMWANGDALNNWFTIEGSGNCAFIFKKGISSANCDDARKYICSRKGVCP
ncbi:C-type lectin domain family 2 member F-like [Rhinolophus ferrumequinum]|uniref:C-type lectin domain family 2 member F-like n=1 Tax=Rhinolophus ferrumequinum TaxID=59479 RepID=UPI00140F5DA6|nr:C-type lectin domain family 2 member F-like [Rhinolophus ferrumequinum]